MKYENALESYAKAKTLNGNKLQQVVMLYDGCLTAMQKAKSAIEGKDVEARYNNLDKAAQIVSGLQASLDYEKGGDVSKILDEYYDSIYYRIMSLHMNQELAVCDSVLNEIKVMRNAWAEIEAGATTDNAANDQGSSEILA
jgi:flagellar protein FliS